MFCKNCGKGIAENAAVCIHCGVKVGDGNKFCPNCGAQPDPLAIVCVNCGSQLKSDNSKETIGSFRTAIDSCFKKYATFTGRANRREYWFFFLFCISLQLLVGLQAFNLAFIDILFKGHYEESTIEMLFFIPTLVIFLPSLAVQVRRLHDIGKSGLWVCIGYIPLIGWILITVLMCLPSQKGDNKYGVNPN